MTNHLLDSTQYLGIVGITKACVEAVEMLLQSRRDIEIARLVTCQKSHGFLLWTNTDDVFIIETGFASGYGGEGPSGLSYVLALLEFSKVEIEEVDIRPALMDKLERRRLKFADTEKIRNAIPVRPTRWYDYVLDRHESKTRASHIWQRVEPLIPFGVVHPAITDLAASFWADPDKALMTAFRRLEGKIRDRTGLDEHGSKLFNRAFANKGGHLIWVNVDEGETAGRLALFNGVYQAFRNPRAHRETDNSESSLVREFLMVNELFYLEESALESPSAK